VYREDYDFSIGKVVMLAEGGDVALFATGSMVAASLGAARILKDAGVSARVVDVHTIKPLDEAAVRKAVAETGLLAAVEEHSVIGGLGAAVAEVAAGEGNAPRLLRIGLPDSFGPIGTYHEQLERHGLTERRIAERILDGLKRRSR
jgi:transketolase